MAGREPLYDCDLRMQRGDGGYLWLHVRGAAQRDPAGRVQRLAGLACDATECQAQERERMRSEARAEETQIQLADAMNLAGDGFGLFDAGDRLVVHNQRLKAIFPEIANFIVKGAFFEDILSAALDAGAIVVAEQDRARWLQDRLAREHQGTGLGLPLVKALVEAHEGSIELDSAVGRGTGVSLHFSASRSRPVPG